MIFDKFGNLTGNYTRLEITENEDYIHPIRAKTEEIVEEEPTGRPILFLSVVVFFAVSVLLGQLIRIQLLSFPHYRNLSSGNSIKIILYSPARGLILDRNNQILSKNISEYVVVANLVQLPVKAHDRNAIYEQVKDILKLTNDQIAKIESARKKGTAELVVKEAIEHEEMLILKEKLAGANVFTVIERPIRNYDTAPGLSHLLGYMGVVNEDDLASGKYLATESVGRSGLEKVYQDDLRGTIGKKYIEVDANGRVVRNLPSLGNVSPTSGGSLKTHLDINLQREVARYLQEAIDSRTKAFGESKKLGASAIVLNPKNGAILSMVSLPNYDNNLFATGISKDDYQKLQTNESLPLINRSIQAQLPSGSVIKPIIATAALDAGTISPNFAIDTPLTIQIGEFTFPDWKDHGRTDIRRAIAESNNIFFYGLGGGWENKIKGLGMDKMNDYFSRFGFGQKSNIDLTGEYPGFVPTPAWKKEKKGERWYIGDTYHFSIGQGDFLTTPLQLANAVAAIANGGTLYEPRLADAFVNSKDSVLKKVEPKVKNQNFISSPNAQVVREGMRQAVEYGSARQLNTLKVHVAAKTGTAQFGNEDRTHAWFVSFAPYEDPEIVVLVVVEGGGGGHESAMPVAEKIYRYYFNDPASVATPTPTPANPDATVPVEDE